MYTISVYIDTGVVFDYEVATQESAREHAQVIALNGYRSATKERPNILTVWPPHRISKVVVKGAITSGYWDTSRGT